MNYKLLLYCRAGFESECASEIIKHAERHNIFGFTKTDTNSAFVLFQPHLQNECLKLWEIISLTDLIFARNILLTTDILENLPVQKRTDPIFAYFLQSFSELLQNQKKFSDLYIETPDTDKSKETLTFCKKFTSPMLSTLKNNGYIFDKRNNLNFRVHLMFLESSRCYVCLSSPKNSSSWFMGIPRLKLPADIPSRSAFKLEEALVTFLSEEERETQLHEGMTAVDLGASPGGWTYIFASKHIHVTAIDNGKMDDKLMKTELVTHLKEDGFQYRPKKPVHWMVCDMIEKPSAVTKLVTQWAKNKLAKNFIFNLKLPMKKKFSEVQNSLNAIEKELQAEKIEFRMNAKHLYHDRDEVTVYLKIYEGKCHKQ